MSEKEKGLAGREPTTYGFERQRLTTTPLRPVVFYKIERRHLCLRPTGRSGVGVSRLNLKPEIGGSPPASALSFSFIRRRVKSYAAAKRLYDL